MASPRFFRLLVHCVRAAASRTFCTAGTSSAIKIAMIAITTSNSIRVNPLTRAKRKNRIKPPQEGNDESEANSIVTEPSGAVKRQCASSDLKALPRCLRTHGRRQRGQSPAEQWAGQRLSAQRTPNAAGFDVMEGVGSATKGQRPSIKLSLEKPRRP